MAGVEKAKRRQERSEKLKNEPRGVRALTLLQKARKDTEWLVREVRDLGFEDWIRRCVQNAERPDEWTQAQTLYENYLVHVKTRNLHRDLQKLLTEEAATFTTWGRMMATQFTKKRRTAGWYYPLRCKRG